MSYSSVGGCIGPECLSRRDAVRAVLATGLALSGCCNLRGFATPAISGTAPANVPTPFKPTVHKSTMAPALCIDAHAHFFNASDVPVKGYLAGPVAHGMQPALRALIEALAPVADELASIAPTAKEEYDELIGMLRPGVMTPDQMASALSSRAVQRRADMSRRAYELIRQTEFPVLYDRLKAAERTQLAPFPSRRSLAPFNPASIDAAMQAGREPAPAITLEARRAEADIPYADGVLAFVGFMLSPRWSNLQEYQVAYSSSPSAFGVDYALGALVDFDRWLDCPPRSAHEDQIKLHHLLSQMSGGYLKPLAAYNPWTDVAEQGRSLYRAVDAVKTLGFAGIKIYPPMGYRPLGNVKGGITSKGIGPSAEELDDVLMRLWKTCSAEGIPVMAHTGHSMGPDDAHDELGGPLGWSWLLDQFKSGSPPVVNAGHFGGDSDANSWSEELAGLMGLAAGSAFYADLGYWQGLRCGAVRPAACQSASARLRRALGKPTAPKRVMYGTDWLMLSQERDWAAYPFDIAKATASLIEPKDLFGFNAKGCFARTVTFGT